MGKIQVCGRLHLSTLAGKTWLLLMIFFGLAWLPVLSLPVVPVTALAGREDQSHVGRYLPIKVEYVNDYCRYAVYSGPFKKFLALQGVTYQFAVKVRPAF